MIFGEAARMSGQPVPLLDLQLMSSSPRESEVCSVTSTQFEYRAMLVGTGPVSGALAPALGVGTVTRNLFSMAGPQSPTPRTW